MYMLATFLEYLIVSGVPEYTVVLVLFLPIVATIVTFTRYILGWKSLTIYASLLLSFALYDLSRTSNGSVDVIRGLVYGGTLILGSTFIAYLFQSLAKEIRLHYLAKVSLILTCMSVAFFFLLYALIQFNERTFISLSPLAVIIIILVVDIFTRGQLRKGPEKSAYLISQTIILSFVLFLIMSVQWTKQILLSHPEIVLYTILINIFVGRWRGFRLSEYLRFKNIKLPEPADTYDSLPSQDK